jgi:hypothetical protein
MPYSKPITFRRLLNAPLDEPDLMPPRQPGVYVVTQHEWAGGEDPPHGDVVYVGKTSTGGLLYRVTQLMADAIGFTGAGEETGSKNSYFHSGARNIWLASREGILPDPRTLHISWNADVCPACEETRLYNEHKSSKGFLCKSAPPGCGHVSHLATRER